MLSSNILPLAAAALLLCANSRLHSAYKTGIELGFALPTCYAIFPEVNLPFLTTTRTSQNVTPSRTGTRDDCAKRGRRAIARRDGAASTVMVTHGNRTSTSFQADDSASLPDGSVVRAKSDPDDIVCYTGGEIVFSNYRMCKVTSAWLLVFWTDRVIVETLDKPQVTFSCDGSSAPCASQFWVVEVEAFYYQSEFFQKEIKGPASFSCKTGAGCKFEGPGMDMLVSALYGDDSMTMDCDVGECLRRSQVPGSSLRKVQ
ncbi:hypothetical protein C8J57DRAFT_1482182 [Mycena rebaudengoi]|nr:hypothetical protein C8J57DRAFT_1482182 [Mycena rebaudengoi]